MSRLYAQLRRHELQRQADAAVRAALGESGPAAGPVTPGGDEERLRGIPVLSRGVAGAIRGTRPGANLR